MIANAGSDERKRISGGSAGDQTGDEYRVRSWYNRPWSCVYRPKSQAVGDMIADIARKAANNDKIGYDQMQRITYYNRLRDANWHPENITSRCETDCSASSAAAVIAAGHRLGISALTNVSSSAYSGNIGSELMGTGQFTKLTASKYTGSSAYLLPGDILVYTGHHVAVNLDAGGSASYTPSSSSGGLDSVSTTTKAPTGLSISRNNNTFTFSWKIADENYTDGQQFCYKFYYRGAFGYKNTHKATYLTIGTSDTSKSVTVGHWNNFYPYSPGYPGNPNKKYKPKVWCLTFWVRGKKDGGSWSSWSEKTLYFDFPRDPKVSASGNYGPDGDSSTTVFSYSVVTDASDAKWTYDLWLETMLVKNCKTNDGSKLTWNSRQLGWDESFGALNSSWAITENEAITQGPDSYTRWFRAKARGAHGDSWWKYTYHTYAKPFDPVIKQLECTNNKSRGLNVLVRWVANAGGGVLRTIDKTTVQYKFAVPDYNYECPAGDDWTDARSYLDTADWDASYFSIDNKPEDDEILYVRIRAEHDKLYSYSTVERVKRGFLSSPTNLNVIPNQTTFRATVTATNESENPSSILLVYYRSSSDKYKEVILGYIPHGQNSVTVQCPDWSEEEYFGFGVQAVVGTPVLNDTNLDNVKTYRLDHPEGGVLFGQPDTYLYSDGIVWEGGEIPLPPKNISVERTNNDGVVRISWSWDWEDANSAQLAWADHEDAWESTDGPETYDLSNLYTSNWNISGLETGKRWYFRVRLAKKSGDEEVYGPWSSIVEYDLSSAPVTPSLTLSKSVMALDDDVTAYWAYTSTDGTTQQMAEICEATVTDDGVEYGRIIAQTESEQHVVIEPSLIDGWTSGQTYQLCVRVVATSGAESDNWSTPVPLTIADPLVASIDNSSLVTETIDEGTEDESDILVLTEMPFNVTVSGAGEGGETTVIIEREQSYFLNRPDDDIFEGHEGETIAIYSQTGDTEITITNDMLIGSLDDGARYRLIATISDGIGQTSSEYLSFTVHWAHQAQMPNAIVNLDLENYIEYIVPTAENPGEGDVCDIYRLSADKPELVVQNGSFNVQYVDPYPTIGDYGGHRIVYKTVNGDYITEDNRLAWVDIGTGLDVFALIIDFDGYRVVLPYDITISNSWAKDFQETKYLGGAVQGDWNAAISRTSSISTRVAVQLDSETIQAMRRLANYPGICHVRTPDGSSYSANVEVTEDREEKWVSKIASFSLNITRVDPEGFDGMTYDEYTG